MTARHFPAAALDERLRQLLQVRFSARAVGCFRAIPSLCTQPRVKSCFFITCNRSLVLRAARPERASCDSRSPAHPAHSPASAVRPE